MMKKTAWLVNTARGEIIDQTALIAALKEGTIAAAGLDTFAQEPPENLDRLWQCRKPGADPPCRCGHRGIHRAHGPRSGPECLEGPGRERTRAGGVMVNPEMYD